MWEELGDGCERSHNRSPSDLFSRTKRCSGSCADLSAQPSRDSARSEAAARDVVQARGTQPCLSAPPLCAAMGHG